MTLTEIANKLGTDKGTEHFEHHSYTETYEKFFNPIKDEKIKMLEIGIADPRFPGASIQMWTEFFSNLYFIGFDINQDCKSYEKNNVKISIGDQSVPEDLNRCVNEYGGDYDIIIDDGLHTHFHHIKSFESLYPYLKEDGLYIIEDLHAYDCALTIEWFKDKKIPFELYNNNKLLIHRKPKKLNLIWQTFNGDQTTFEFEYTTEILFKDFELNKIFDDGKLSTVLDNSVIIYSNNSNGISEEFNNYLNKFVDNGYKFNLLHFSNENLGHNCDYYSKANHVFRNYYDPNITSQNVIFIPLGVKSGFVSKHTNINPITKEYEFTFIGQPKSDRQELLSVIEQMENVFIHKTNSWNCSTALTQDECISIYNKTKFVPCPMGWVHPDSFRLMECLESGAIPILKNYNNLEYFSKVWGDSPLPIVNSWNEIATYYKMNEEDYNQLSNSVFNWYEEFKHKLSLKIKNGI
jgi:hypothetical protein